MVREISNDLFARRSVRVHRLGMTRLLHAQHAAYILNLDRSVIAGPGHAGGSPSVTRRGTRRPCLIDGLSRRREATKVWQQTIPPTHALLAAAGRNPLA